MLERCAICCCFHLQSDCQSDLKRLKTGWILLGLRTTSDLFWWLRIKYHWEICIDLLFSFVHPSKIFEQFSLLIASRSADGVHRRFGQLWCDFPFFPREDKVLVVGLWNRYGVEGLSGVWLQHFEDPSVDNHIQSQNLSRCWDSLNPEGFSTFSCTEDRFSVTMIEWTHPQTETCHARCSCNICKRSLLFCWHLFNFAACWDQDAALSSIFACWGGDSAKVARNSTSAWLSAAPFF